MTIEPIIMMLFLVGNLFVLILIITCKPHGYWGDNTYKLWKTKNNK